MRRAWLVFGIALLVPGCDARKLFGEDWTVQKSCEKTTDCVFQTTTGTSGMKQQICETSTGQCRTCGLGSGQFDLTAGTKECRDGYSKALVCDKDATTCRSCQQLNQECFAANPALPVCDTTAGVCKACANDVECQSEGFVTCNGGLCSGCKSSADCKKPANPVCTVATGACVPCTMDAECSPTQLCNTATNPYYNTASERGQCASPSIVAWVNNNPGCAAGGDGTLAKPYCTLATAVTNGNIKYIHLTKSTIPYTLSTGVNRELYLFGKGDVPGDVIVSALSVNSGKLTLSNLSIKDTGKSLIACMGGSLVLSKTILDGGTRGVDALTGCTDVNIQQTKVLNATGIGISIAGSATYTIINSGVFYNARTTGEAGVSLVTTGSGKFAFNTIQNNGKGGGTVGGLDCGTSSKAIANTLITDNTLKASTQIAGSCTFTKVVVNAADATGINGAIKQDPMYSGDGQLQATDMACIDKADADPSVVVDYAGGKRPLGAAPDIGYHEAK